MTLTEFADEVIGVEREPHLVETARSLLPAIDFQQQDTILRLPTIDDDSIDFAKSSKGESPNGECIAYGNCPYWK